MKWNPKYPCPNCGKLFRQGQLRGTVFSRRLKCPHCAQVLRAELPKKHQIMVLTGAGLLILLVLVNTLFSDWIDKGVVDVVSLVVFLYFGAWHGLKLANGTVYHKAND